MSVKFINYTKEQRRGMAVSGYSLYVNGSHYCIHETLTGINQEVKRYPSYNDIEIYPILTRRY